VAVVDCLAAESDHLLDNLLSWRKSIPRQTESRFHDECISLTPLRLLSGLAGPQFEIPRVKQCLITSEKETLGGPKDVAGRQQHKIEPAHGSPFAKWQDMLGPPARKPALHQTRGSLRDDDLIVGRDVVNVRVRNEGEAFCIPGVEPQILVRQINAALKTNINHRENLGGKDGKRNYRTHRFHATHIDMQDVSPFHYGDETYPRGSRAAH
jgi:hypothetical protein